MGRFVKGDVVVLNFPFSDLTGTKRRPALVLSDLTGNDIILCQITSIATKDWAIRKSLRGKRKRSVDMLVGTQSKFNRRKEYFYSIENEIIETGVKLYG
jgi:mRNA-degrading endonuclease toxin of MazEF toxin-antitoxin module